MNSFLCAVLGVPLEALHGSIRMTIMFNIGVLGGACAYFVADAHRVVVGCSGGCYALIGMHFADHFLNWERKKFRLPTIVFLLFLIAVDVFTYIVSLSASNSSHSAHVGGFIAGSMIGIVLGRNLEVSNVEKVLMVLLFLLGVAAFCVCVIWLVIRPYLNI